MNTLKDHVKAGSCSFVRARSGSLWYSTSLGLEFPVSMDTIGEATFEATIPALSLMGCIRSQLSRIEAERQRPEYAAS